MSAAYEACLLFGVTFIAAYLWLALLQWRWPLSGLRLTLFQIYVYLIIGLYFVYFWRLSGQTLAMKTWRICLRTQTGQRLGVGRSIWRYMLIWWGVFPSAVVANLAADPTVGAAGFIGCCVLSWAWALVDPDRQFLYDRLARTRLVAM